jgi:hypothetical protein
MITERNKFKLNQVPGSDANSGCLFAALLPCCPATQSRPAKTQNNCPSLLSTLPTRENVLAPGYQRISWPPSPKPPATRASLINMIQPVSPVSLSEHTHTSQSRARLTVKRIQNCFSCVHPPPNGPHIPLIPALFLPANSHSILHPLPVLPSAFFINVPYLLGIFWASRPAYATLGSAAIPLLTLFYFFFLNFCHSSLNALFSLIIAQLIMLIFFN